MFAKTSFIIFLAVMVAVSSSIASYFQHSVHALCIEELIRIELIFLINVQLCEVRELLIRAKKTVLTMQHDRTFPDVVLRIEKLLCKQNYEQFDIYYYAL